MVLINPGVAVRGMMYYRRALKLQAFLDMANEDGMTSRMLSISCITIT